jgi:pyrimidine-specific ribonucleoside hydrolase
MSGLDVTHKALVVREDIERIRKLGTKSAVMVAELLDFFAKFHEENFAFFGGSPLHDPCAVAWLIAPELFTSRSCHVDIETQGELTLGATVVDYHDVLGKEKNVQVLFDVDREGFVDLLAEHLVKLP